MDAVMYLKEKNRMTMFNGRECTAKCSECPISEANNDTREYCVVFEKAFPEKAVEIVGKWSKEHTQKTYLSDLLEKYPKAQLEDGDYPGGICPHTLGYREEVKCCGDCKDCWNTPMEE